MFHACAVRFNVIKNLEKVFSFLGNLNKAKGWGKGASMNHTHGWTRLTVALRPKQAALYWGRAAWHGAMDLFCGSAWLARVRCFHVTIAIFLFSG
jgi:hypothetical protein